MRMLRDYNEFYELCKEGKVYPDVRSNLGHNSVQFLRGQGWKIGGNIFNRKKHQTTY
jgi:hypothetical protein